MRKIAALFLRYFLQGLIIISPIAITAWAAYSIFDFIDTKIPSMPRGVGFVIIISSLVVIGWLGSTFLIWKLLINFFDSILKMWLKVLWETKRNLLNQF
jgi:uncharacterized membrane protein